MDPNQEEDLKKLSYRTEELLSRLNDLSNTLNSQLKTSSAPTTTGVPSVPAQANPPSKSTIQSNEIPKPEAGNGFYSIPINTHYLEKRERSIKTTGNGEQFLTTSTSSIFTEHHHIGTPPENFVPVSLDPQFFPPALPPVNDVPSSPPENTYQSPGPAGFQNVKEPTPSFSKRKLDFDFKMPSEPEAQISGQSLRFQPEYKPERETSFQAPPDEYDAPEHPLQPSAIFSIDQNQTKRAPVGRRQEPAEEYKGAYEAKPKTKLRSQRITDKLEAQNKELKDRLQKYSNRLQISSNGDILKFFAFVAPFFLLGGAIGIINALGIPIYDLPKIFAICSIMVFLGIFFSAMALRLVEISELVRWAHNEILHMQSILDEQKDKHA